MSRILLSIGIQNLMWFLGKRCKCLINGIKVATKYDKVKVEAKRQVALRALRKLQKIFPTVEVRVFRFD